MWDYLKLVLLGAVAVLMLYLASQSRDLAYTVAALIGLLSAVVAFIYSLRGMGNAKAPKTGYLDGPVRIGVILTAFWGVVGFLVGVVIAFQLAYPQLNFAWAEGYLNFGRLRPLHTSAVIFAFGGTGLITSSLYIVQRTSGARLWNDGLAWFVFWGYQITIQTRRIPCPGWRPAGSRSRPAEW